MEISTHSSDPPNPWEGYQQALRSGLSDESDPSHVLILQEDVVVCNNFPKALRKVSKAKPDDPISSSSPACLDTPAGRCIAPPSAEALIRAYPGDLFFPALAILWPSKIAREFLEWAGLLACPVTRTWWPPTTPSSGSGSRRHRPPPGTPFPLVDHPDQVESVIGKRAQWGKGRNRVALMFCDGEPLAYTW